MAVLRPAVLLLCAFAASALNVAVDVGGEECFYEELIKDIAVRGSFLVASAQADIDCRVKSPSGATLYSVDRQTEGHFDIAATTSGEHSVCFANKGSSGRQTVSFSIHTGVGLPESAVAKQGKRRGVEIVVGVARWQGGEVVGGVAGYSGGGKRGKGLWGGASIKGLCRRWKRWHSERWWPQLCGFTRH